MTTLTKKLAEELPFLAKKRIKARYLHSDIKTIERTKYPRTAPRQV